MHIFTGIVVRGTGRAEKLGYPTVNIPLTDPSVSGIYAGEVMFKDMRHPAALFADPRRGVLEAHLIGFDSVITEARVTMTLVVKVRGGQTFDNDEALQAAIAEDVLKVKRIFLHSQEH